MMPQLEATASTEVMFEREDATGPSLFGPAPGLAIVHQADFETLNVVWEQFPSFLDRAYDSMRVVIYWSYRREPATIQSDLRTTIEVIRRSTALPVNEVATMVGLKRRSLYKIIEDNKTASKTESWIYYVNSAISKVADRFHEPELVRTALLTPIPEFGSHNFVQIASDRDRASLTKALAKLLSEAGRQSVDRQWHRTRPLTRSGEHAAAFIAATAPLEDGLVDDVPFRRRG